MTDLTLLSLSLSFINMDLVLKKIPHVLCYQWALENTLAAAEAPWPLFKQMAMKWFDAVPVHVPAGKHTRSIIGATQVPQTISKFRDSNSPFSYYGPKFRTLKTCYQNCDNKNVSKFLKMRSVTAVRGSLTSHREGLLHHSTSPADSVPLTRKLVSPWSSPHCTHGQLSTKSPADLFTLLS